MNANEQEQRSDDRREPAARPFDAVALLSSMRFAVGLVIAIAAACAVATLLPQGPAVAERLQHDPEAGRWLKRLAAAGLTNVFSAWWFIGLLTTLGASLAACVARRVKALGASAAGRTRRRMAGTLCVHVGLLLTLLGGVIRLGWSERGTIQLREGEQVAFFNTDDQRRADLPFTLQLVKFEIERYPAPGASTATAQPAHAEMLAIQWPGEDAGEEGPVEIGVAREVKPPASASATNQDWRVTVLRRVPDFVVDTNTRTVQSRSAQMVNPAILVRAFGPGVAVERWLFARYPDFDMDALGAHQGQPLPFKMLYRVLVNAPEKPRSKTFKSTLRILHGATVVREQTIEVNAPLLYGGYGFYQATYDASEEDLSWTGLLVVRDPGVPVVYLGFVLLLAGVTVTACWRVDGASRPAKEKVPC
ncbi:MAG: cytochrome c biogenesis protein ResB [Kiritimatiellaeota bacterium]|nr:cytochrome c biogenesis protein ResB [Kiritimatiellota bacterium]